MTDFNVITGISTVVLAIITGWYAITTKKILEQSRYQQEVEYIQKRLELLYYPLQLSMYCNYRDSLCYWNDNIKEDVKGPDDAPWDNDTILEEILERMVIDFENYYNFSYLARSDELNKKLEKLSNFLYDEGRLISGNWEERRSIYTDDKGQFFKLCHDITNMVDKDILEYKNQLNKPVKKPWWRFW